MKHITIEGVRNLAHTQVALPPGATVLFGANGSGKSTIAHLLMRFEDPQAGAIFIDDTDATDVSIASIRSQIGLVAQQVLLLNGTVADNIAFGLAGADSEAIETAARSAHAHTCS